MVDWPEPRTLGVVLFERFDLLDATGPLHAFGMLKNVFEQRLLAVEPGPVESAQGPILVADTAFEAANDIDYLLVPGGIGARERAKDEAFLAWLQATGTGCELLMSVSTGSVLLARAGLLDGVRATTGTRAMKWAKEQAPRVSWVPSARWVDAGRVVTAAGVSAGIDMALHVITRLTAPDVGENVARSLEHDWHADASHDPFADGAWRARGLVP